MKNHCLARCHLHILYVSHCQENFIASKHEHPANFYNIEHMSYFYWVSECSCARRLSIYDIVYNTDCLVYFD